MTSSPQKLLLFGATGHVGQRVVQRGMAEGLAVVAFVRPSSDTAAINLPGLDLVRGDVLDADAVREAVRLHQPEVVISAIGPHSPADSSVISVGLTNIVAALEKQPHTRLLTVAGAGLLQDPEHGLVLYHPQFPPFLGSLAQQHLLAWETLQSSALDYVCLCPPKLTAGSDGERFETRINEPVRAGLYSATYDACARYLIQQTLYPTVHRQRVSICSSTY